VSKSHACTCEHRAAVALNMCTNTWCGRVQLSANGSLSSCTMQLIQHKIQQSSATNKQRPNASQLFLQCWLTWWDIRSDSMPPWGWEGSGCQSLGECQRTKSANWQAGLAALKAAISAWSKPPPCRRALAACSISD